MPVLCDQSTSRGVQTLLDVRQFDDKLVYRSVEAMVVSVLQPFGLVHAVQGSPQSLPVSTAVSKGARHPDTSNGVQHLLFAVFTSGNMQIYFQAYQNRPGFESEEKRMELRNKLNDISGVNILPDGISKYPSIPLSVFFDEDNLNHFFQIYEWFFKEIE